MISKLMTVLLFFVTAEVRVNLDDKVSIIFPDTPEKTGAGEQVVFLFTTENFIYNAGFIDLNKMNNISDKKELEKFYDRFIKGILDAAANSKLIEKSDFEISKYQGKEIIYTKSFNGIDNIKVVKRIFLIKKRVYLYEIWALNGDMDKKELKNFFSSAKVEE